MTATDPALAHSVDSALARVQRATHPYDLEGAWTAGLRGEHDPEARDRLLASAGRRLGSFGEESEDILREHWLSDVVNEFRMRGEGALGDELCNVAVEEIQEAFARARAEFGELRESLKAGEGMVGYAEWATQGANRISDLGRIAKRLRGSGLMALVSTEDADLAREFAAAMLPPAPLLATVPECLRVSRDDLLRWAEAERELPRLVRLLVAETALSVERIDIPAGTAVSKPGWDGMVSCSMGNRFVPAGLSVWELSASKSNPGRKARQDYDKRVSVTLPEERADTTYVTVVCASWPEARDFQREKSQTGDYHYVRAIDVDGIEAWLECAPLTTVWLRDSLGKPATGICLLSAWWAKWLEATTPKLDTRVVLAGRDKQAEALRERCRKRQGGTITIGGSVHRDEILAFVAAALSASEPSTPPFPDTLYVDDPDIVKRLLAEAPSMSKALRQCAARMTLVVPSAEFAQYLPAASHHQMIVPVPGSPQAKIVLKAVDSAVVVQEMEAAGMDHRIAHEMGSLARMSLLSLRRHLAVDSSLHRPAWATGSVDIALRRSLLLCGWNEGRDGDREIVERFAAQSHQEVTETLKRLDPGDAPMTLTGDMWHSVSPVDTWKLMGCHLSHNDIAQFAEIAHEVLTEPDPFWGLTYEERLNAQYDGTKTKFSSHLKQGIAKTLALLGSKPPVLWGDTAQAMNTAEVIVWKVLESADSDATPKTWSAVSKVLPLLAEAAPDIVLEGLRTCLSRPHVFARAMFTDSNSGDFLFTPASPHSRILNTLEVMAWSPEHLTSVADLLARLSMVDPGGSFVNRPATTLASIMCTWMPYTSASDEERLKAIRMLRRSHGEVAWQLMLSMLPGAHTIRMPAGKPRYREWQKADQVVSLGDYDQMVTSIAGMLVEDVGEDPDRWVELLAKVSVMPAEIRSSATETLSRLAAGRPDEAFKSKVWPQLRILLENHRQFSDTQWALDESELAPFDKVLDCLQPLDPSLSHKHLFSSDLMSIDGISLLEDSDTFQKMLESRQAEAVKTLLNQGGIEAVLEFAKTVEQPQQVGLTLAHINPHPDICILSTSDADVLKAMDAAPAALTQAAVGYFSHRFKVFGWEGIDRLIVENDPPHQVVADLHRAPTPAELPWKRLDALATDVSTEYWARVTYYDIARPDDLNQLLDLSRRLRKSGRFDIAGSILAFSRCDKSQLEFLEEVAVYLEQCIQTPPPLSPDRFPTKQTLNNLIQTLNNHQESLGNGRLARIEWLYFPILWPIRDFKASNLYRELAADPNLFVQLVETAYTHISDSLNEPHPLTGKLQQTLLDAFHVLQNWPRSLFAPGQDKEGQLDAESLKKWVDRARKNLSEKNLAKVGDMRIGTALASSPPDPNEEWPGIAVRNLLEELQNNDIEDGMITAIYNQSGVYNSSKLGGGQERDLAHHNRAQCQHFQEWPRTAAIFKSLARNYERLAEIHDCEAEAQRHGLPL